MKHDEPVAQPDPIPVAPPPVESGTANNDSSHDTGPPMQEEDMYGNGQHGDTDPGWNGAQDNDGQGGEFSNGPVQEEEPPRIGIKEDG